MHVPPVYIDEESQFFRLSNIFSTCHKAREKGHFTIEIRHRISGTLGPRVHAISDDMLVELAVSCLDESHGASVCYAPESRAHYRTNEVPRT